MLKVDKVSEASPGQPHRLATRKYPSHFVPPKKPAAVALMFWLRWQMLSPERLKSHGVSEDEAYKISLLVEPREKSA